MEREIKFTVGVGIGHSEAGIKATAVVMLNDEKTPPMGIKQVKAMRKQLKKALESMQEIQEIITTVDGVDAAMEQIDKMKNKK
jgi:hypothetical protein